MMILDKHLRFITQMVIQWRFSWWGKNAHLQDMPHQIGNHLPKFWCKFCKTSLNRAPSLVVSPTICDPGGSFTVGHLSWVGPLPSFFVTRRITVLITFYQFTRDPGNSSHIPLLPGRGIAQQKNIWNAPLLVYQGPGFSFPKNQGPSRGSSDPGGRTKRRYNREARGSMMGRL